MALSHNHGSHSHAHSHAAGGHLSVAAPEATHGHDHGSHFHDEHAAPSFRLDVPAWSILRASLAERLAIAAVLVLAIWGAVIATLWNAA